MHILHRLFGSRYDKTIPYGYEAVIKNDIPELELDTFFLGPTICELVKYMKKNTVEPDRVKIFELFNDREKELPREMYLDDDQWLNRTNLCKITKRYGEEECFPKCRFQDRRGVKCGHCTT